MELFLFVPGVVWASLLIVMALRRVIRWAIRSYCRADLTVTPQPGRGVNWFYLGVIALSVIVPILAALYSEGRSRGNRPYGLFMIALYIAGIVFFVLGQARARHYARWNAYWVVLIFIIFPLAVEWLFLLNFGSNFSV